MTDHGFAELQFVVKTIAQTCVDNERAFGELDSVVGDGDFGYSLARGFELVLKDWDGFDRSSAGVFLQKIAIMITARIGGTSGPIWGTAFLRAASVVKSGTPGTALDAVAMLRAAIAGIMERGGAAVGDKTLLDALVPMTDTIERCASEGVDAKTTLAAAAVSARSAADATCALQARRGRASYSGERSIGSPDAGAMAVAIILERIAAEWSRSPLPS